MCVRAVFARTQRKGPNMSKTNHATALTTAECPFCGKRYAIHPRTRNMQNHGAGRGRGYEQCIGVQIWRSKLTTANQ